MTRAVAALVVMIGLGAGAALACDRPVGSRTGVDPGRIDQSALSQAILAEVNYARCQSGQRALRQAPNSLTASTTAHSAWMAQVRRLSHLGRGASGRDLRTRVQSAGIPMRTASENIAQLPRFAFGGQRFRVIDRGSCQFQNRDGRQIAPHSYSSLAERVVALWLASPGHRRNVLDPGVTAMAAGTAFSQSDTCGDFWITQIFVG